MIDDTLPVTQQLVDWLAYIQTVHHNEIELGLARITAVAEKCHCLQFTCPVILVAGTNGKGTTVAMLSEIYQQAGYTVATYTSPHLLIFNERIKINKEYIDDATLCGLFSQVERARGDIKLTFFEYTTLAALLYFQQQQPDVILLEIGLGGRLDAVNCVTADCAVITTISLDHQDILGDTRELIAREKAGILRLGKPVICGDLSPPDCIAEMAIEMHCPLYLSQQHFFYSEDAEWSWWSGQTRIEGLPPLSIPKQNAATALMTVEVLQSRLPVRVSALLRASREIEVSGRLQVLSTPIKTIVDVAHNGEASHYLAQQIQQQYPCTGKRWALFSMLKGKDIYATVTPWTTLIDHWIIAPIHDQRAATLSAIAEAITTQCADADIIQHPSLPHAYSWLSQQADINDMIIVFGSFHTVGELLASIR